MFDISNGLSAAGGAVEKTAGAYTLEQQKADLESQKIVLADQLAGARQEKQNTFQTSERVATQGFTAGENVENRKSAKDIAQLSADAAVKAAGIHAGGTVTAAQIGATTAQAQMKQQADEFEKKLAQNQPLVDAEVLTKSIGNSNAKELSDARSAVGEARKSGDPAQIKAAQQRVYDAEYSAQAQVQQASVYQAQAKIAETAVTSLQTRLVALQDPMKAMNPETKALADSLTNQLKKAQTDYASAVRMAEDAVKNLPSYNPPSAGTAAPDLSKYMKPSMTTPPAAPKGLIDTPANP